MSKEDGEQYLWRSEGQGHVCCKAPSFLPRFLVSQRQLQLSPHLLAILAIDRHGLHFDVESGGANAYLEYRLRNLVYRSYGSCGSVDLSI
jgi:hypothetical protein